MKSVHGWSAKEQRQLYQVINKLKTSGEVRRFLRDLCTQEELVEMAKRWQAAKLLHRGKSYREVAKKTGLSTSTVTRVAQWLNEGEGGYRLALRQS